LGIGTDSPAFASGSGLEVQRAADATVRVERTGATNSAGEFIAASGIVRVGATSGSPFAFITDNTERVRITSTGSVGIGITNPGTNIQISSTDSMGTGSATADILSVTNQNGVVSGIAGDKLGIVISAMNDLSDRRVGLYCRAQNANFNNPDFSIFQTGQGIAFRETLRVSANSTANLQFNSGYGSVATAYGCRAWGHLQGNSLTVIRSGNISSITQNSTGNYDANFTTSMPDANYSCVGNAENLNDSTGLLFIPYNYFTATINFLTAQNGTLARARIISLAVFR